MKWLRRQLIWQKNFEHVETETTNFLIDRSETAVQLCEQQGIPQSEEIQLRMLLARPHNEKELTVAKCSAAQMGADMLTKHASVGVIRYNRKILGMF